MTIYGYARVSTDGQSLASQDAQLRAAGCAKVFAEKVSGAKSDRAELARVLKRLGEGDVLVVTRLDRLARSTRDLLNILALDFRGGREIQIAERCLGRHDDAAWRLDAHGAGRACQFERELILARTGDGRTRAKARGVKFGRPAALTPHQRQEAIQRLSNGEAQADIARSFAVSQATISRLVGGGPFGEGAAVQ